MASTSKSSNFHDRNNAFLSQTRIWIEEVLHIRLDEHMDISDLLADGKLLLELSEVIDSRMRKIERKSVSSGKSTKKFDVHANVGSFLGLCKTLGVKDADLFTSSYVVDKQNTRKVCMCIRQLSIRARLKRLDVPDFDNVTRTLSIEHDSDEVTTDRNTPISSSGEEIELQDNNKELENGENDGSTSISESVGSYSDQEVNTVTSVLPFVGGANSGSSRVEDDIYVDETPISAIKSPLTGFTGVDVNSYQYIIPHLDLNPSISSILIKDGVICTEGSHDTHKGESEHTNTEKEMEEISEPLNPNPNPIPQRRLLKSVIKGAAVVGFAFFLLRLRKTNSRECLPKPKEKPKEVLEANTPKSKPLSQKDGSSQCVYPSDRLCFGV